MKKAGIVIIALVLVASLCGGFYYIKSRADANSGENQKLTKVQKLITRNMDENYPKTPRAVVKLYNQFVSCYYKEKYTDEELDSLVEQAQKLFDDELLQNNPKDELKASVIADVKDYKDKSRVISQTSVCDTEDVQYVTDKEKGDSLAYVQAYYFIKEKKKFFRTYQMYVLREDASGRWKIVHFYQVEGNKTEESQAEDDE